MTLRHLQIFRVVCEEESITRAAEKLNMTQPAVSIAIRELESFYQVSLFERLNRKIFLTEAAHTLLQYADTLTEQFEEAVRVMRRESHCHTCRLGANVTTGEIALAVFAQKIRRAVPDIDLRLVVNNSRTIEAMLMQNALDFAIVNQVSDRHNWKSTLLSKEKMVVVASSGLLAGRKSMTVSELSREPLLLREQGSGSRKCVDAVFQRHGQTPSPVLESISTLSLIEMAKRGLGFAILPREVVLRELACGEIQTVDRQGDAFERHFYLIYHNRKFLTDTLQTVMDVLCTS